MRLAKIRIRNYRQYRDLELPKDGELSQATLLVAHVGAGKTNLLNAINWCLYDEELYAVDGNRSLPFVNKGRLGEGLQPGEEPEASVQLLFMLDDRTSVRITRKRAFRVVGPTHVEPKGKSELTVQLSQPNSDWTTLGQDEAREWVERYLPNRIRPYYMLNLERMQQFIHDTESDKVQQAVLSIAQIDVLERLIKRLGDVRRDWFSVSGGGAGEHLERLAKDVSDYTDRVQNLDEAIAKKTDAVDSLAAEIAELDAKLEVHQDAYEADLKLKAARSGLAEAERNYVALEEQLRTTVAASAGFVLAQDALVKAERLVATEKAAHRYPPPIDAEYLRELLSPSRQSCICRRPLTPGTTEYAEVESLLPEKMRVGELGQFLMEHESGIAVGRDRAATFQRQTSQVREQMSTLDSEIARCQNAVVEHGNTLDALGGVNPEVGLVKDQRAKAQHLLSDADKAITSDKKDRDSAQAQLEKTEKAYKLELRKDASRQKTAASLEFTERCLDAAEQVYEDLLGTARARVSGALDTAFKHMMVWKGETYTAATVDDDYHVSVDTSDGWEATGSLSGGENVCLAIAFGQALGEVSGFDSPPLIFDSPLVNLDPSTRVSVAESIGENLKDRQLALLMKPGEFDDAVITALRASLPALKVMDMAFDQREQSTSVTER
ncbi:MAG: AAA family ATPase [Coriobacteriia bacterium]|nr:AAA family ATPase [Coriobacteriia bacterium]